MHARGLGLYLVVLAGGIALGSALWGGVAGWSIPGPVIAAGVLVAGIATARRWRLGVVKDLDLRPATSTAPIVMLEPDPTAGPVLVTVSYRVPESAHAEFVEMMRSVERDRGAAGRRSGGCSATSPTPTDSSRRSRSRRGASTSASTSAAPEPPT